MAGSKKAAKQATADTRVDKDITAVTQVGLKALGLLDKYSAKVAPRLPPDAGTNLKADLTSVGVVVPAAKGAHDDSVQATAQQASALEEGFNLVTAIRTSVARARPGRNVTLAYGVGAKVNRHLVKDVTNALQKIIKRIKAFPAEGTTYGLAAGDDVDLAAKVKAITDADQAQEQARAAKPQSTKQRNATARRILTAVDRIAGAGMIAFANSASERAEFEALIKKVN